MTQNQLQKPLTDVRSVWLIGIKGTGMTPIAQILCRRGKTVGGSDVAEDFFTKEVLDALPVTIKNFTANNITKNIDLVVYSTAYADDHVELKKARELGIPALSLPEMHKVLMEDKKSIAVAGTHGKTTTTSLIGYMLQQADVDPTVIVGAPVPQFDGSALVGGSDFFVLEACEYGKKFDHYLPKTLVLTNIDYDHPDVFSDRDAYVEEFIQFALKIPSFGFIIANVDDINVQKVINRVSCEVVQYGSVPSAHWRIERDIQYAGSQAQGFIITHQGNLWAKGETDLIGHFNLLNILAAVVTVQKFGVSQDIILKAVKRFRAPKRRGEYKGTTKSGALVIDDFGHHPTELQATFRALKEQYVDKELIAVFHPHTFTRTKELLSDFAQSFKDVDRAIVLDIYGSAREDKGGITTEDLVAAVTAVSHNAEYIPTMDEVYEELIDTVDEKHVIVTIGAGDVWQLADKLTNHAYELPGKETTC
ncbi:MAG: UDP-N-acetylmuramate--L-alanine ligase [Patescibacteria group bacterium]